jgi:hypothetical protein
MSRASDSDFQSTDLACLAALRNGNALQAADKICTFKCENSKAISVTEVKGQFIVSGASAATTLKCNDTLTPFFSAGGNLGAHLVKIPCNCELLHDGKIIVQKQFPCSLDLAERVKVNLLLPKLWTKTGQVGLVKSANLSHTAAQLVRLDWTEKLPVVNLSKPHLLEADPFRLLGNFKIEQHMSFDVLLGIVLVQMILWLYVIFRNPEIFRWRQPKTPIASGEGSRYPRRAPPPPPYP